MLEARGSYHGQLPAGHNETCAAVNETAMKAGVVCTGGRAHDVDVIYSARFRVVYAFCLRCMKELPVGGRRPYNPENVVIHSARERHAGEHIKLREAS